MNLASNFRYPLWFPLLCRKWVWVDLCRPWNETQGPALPRCFTLSQQMMPAIKHVASDTSIFQQDNAPSHDYCFILTWNHRFTSFTYRSGKMRRKQRNVPQESRRDWLLHWMPQHGGHSVNATFCVWRTAYWCVLCFRPSVFFNSFKCSAALFKSA